LLGFKLDDCFYNFCMNNIPVAQLQIASLVDELMSLRKGFVTFDCDNFLSKSDIIVLLNAACIEYGGLQNRHPWITFANIYCPDNFMYSCPNKVL